MSITMQQFRDDMSRYFRMSETEDILIMVDGNIVAKLTNPNQNKVQTAKSLIGYIPSGNYTLEDAKRERLARV